MTEREGGGRETERDIYARWTCKVGDGGVA